DQSTFEFIRVTQLRHIDQDHRDANPFAFAVEHWHSAREQKSLAPVIEKLNCRLITFGCKRLAGSRNLGKYVAEPFRLIALNDFAGHDIEMRLSTVVGNLNNSSRADDDHCIMQAV